MTPSLSFLTGVSCETGRREETLSPQPDVATEGKSGRLSISYTRPLWGTWALLIIISIQSPCSQNSKIPLSSSVLTHFF